MIKEQIDVEILVTDLEQDLSADERKSGAEFEQEALNVINECLLYFALAPWIGGAQEVKQVRIFEDMRRHIRLHRRQSRFEIADSLPMAPVRMTLDLQHEDGLAPAMLNNLAGIPETISFRGDFLQQRDIVIPSNLCKG